MLHSSDLPAPTTLPGTQASPEDPPLGGVSASHAPLTEARRPDSVLLFHRVARAAAGSPDLQHILAVIQDELNSYLAPNLCVIWLTAEVYALTASDEAGDCSPTRPDAGRSDPHHELVLAEPCPAFRPRVQALGLEPGFRRDVWQTPFVVCMEKGETSGADLRRSSEGADELTARLADRGLLAWLGFPLRAGDRPAGVLQGLCLQPGGFPPEQVELLQLVADLLGPAVSNCLLVARLRRAYEELRLAQSQLIQAEKLRALGELAGGMAHEFNNALCGVLGFLEVALLNPDLDPTSQGHLESARECALHAARTVRRVHDFASQSRREMVVQPIDLNQLARQTVESTRHKWECLTQVRGTPIRVELITGADVAVTGSPAELREVLSNLVSNAAEAMPAGGTLTVHTWNTATDAFVSVGDTGMGLSDAARARLFEPFFTTKGERGNGLGLSVAFGIVQRHRGEIQVESQIGKGTTFTVRLPLRAEAADARPRDPDSLPAGKAPAGPLHILVIDDDDGVRRFLRTALAGLGHQVDDSTDAEGGLAAFDRGRFDLVITDLGLPGASGQEVARVIRLRSPQTPVVMLTGWADQLANDPKRPEGVTRVLGKPVTVAALKATLAEVCLR